MLFSHNTLKKPLYLIITTIVLSACGGSSSSSNYYPVNTTAPRPDHLAGKFLNPVTDANITQTMAVGDIDGDSDMDLVIGNDGANTVWLNDGNGSFSSNGQALGNNDTRALVLGDVDADGDLDMVAANYRQDTLVWINQGGLQAGTAGTFADSGQALNLGNSQNRATSAVLGDLDADGDLDLITGNNQSQANIVWINQGGLQAGNAGEFIDSQSFGASVTQALVLADLDGDTDLDLVEGNSGSANRIWSNNGSGTMTLTAQQLGTTATRSLAIADVNADNHPDIVEGNGFGDANLVWLNNGSGSFSSNGQTLGTGDTRAIAIGDINGDGEPDLVAGNFNEGNTVYLNNGSGSFTDAGLSLGTNATLALVLVDADIDEDLDIITGNQGQSNNTWINNSSAEFSNSGQALDANTTTAGNTTAVTYADVDGDNDMDMIAADFAQGNRVYTNDGLGNYTNSGQNLGTRNSTSVAAGDVDGDGDTDFVIGNHGEANTVWINQGGAQLGTAGDFADNGQALGSAATTSVALGDVDGDGDLDLVAGNNGAGNTVWINQGGAQAGIQGNFSDSTQALGTAATTSVALGDVDGDGDLDLVAGNDGQSNAIWINQGGIQAGIMGSFSNSGQFLGTANTTAIALADVDSDNDLDIVAGNNGQGNTIWTNNAGIFTDSMQSLGTAATTSVALGDVNGDGNIDLVCANSGAANTVWLNDGSGTFSDSGHALGTGDSRSVFLADVDNDADLDIASGNYAVSNRVYINLTN